MIDRKYGGYSDLNINLHLEIHSKKYGDSIIERNGHYVNTERFNYLRHGYRISIYPSIQFIFNSKLRVDISMEQPVYTSSSVDTFSMLMIGVQRNFY